ncbi:MAG: hypothetical protein ABSC50_03315 [Candidatus Bathyarchaeia archaeon]
MPTLCVFTKPEYDRIDVRQPSDISGATIQSQSEGCYQKFTYYDANKTYNIPFEWNTTVAGGYYFLFLTNVGLVPSSQPPVRLIASQQDFVPNKFQTILPIVLASFTALLGVRLHRKRSNGRN